MRSLDFIEAALNCSADALFVLDEQGQFVYANQAASHLTGFTNAELLTKTVFELDASLDQEQLLEKREQLFIEHSMSIESRIRTKSGELIPVEINSNYMVFEGGQFCCSSIRDITERKKAEENLRITNERLLLAGKATDDPIYDWDILTGQVFWNETSPAVFHYERDKSKSTLEWWKSKVHPEDRQEVLKSLQDAIRGRQEFWSMEYRFLCGDGTYKTVLDRGYIIFDAAGIPIRMIGSMLDITQRKAFEHELLAAKLEAEEATLAKSEFLANISHEIRTPLSALLGAASLIKPSKLNAEQTELVRIIETSSNMLLALIDDVLDFSKIESGKIELKSEPFSIRQSVINVLKLIAGKAEEKRLILDYSIQNEVPICMAGDPVRLQQVLINLLNNAIKFTTHGKISLTCRLLQATNQAATLEFSVNDTGIGISKENLEKIFEAFTQIPGKSNRRHGGVGLGLSICSRLVQAMGGTITAESTVNQGSCFRVELTFPFAEECSVDHSPPVEIVMDSQFGKNNPLSILIAEDSKMNVILLQKMMQRFGYQVDVAQNGREALSQCQRNRYDLVLMDITMPEMDGLDAAQEIRNSIPDNEQPLIIALTAAAAVEDYERSKQAGLDGYFTKPYTTEEIYRCLQLAISRKKCDQAGSGSLRIGHKPR